MSVSIKYTKSPDVSPEEKRLLQEIYSAIKYPVCRFELRSSAEKEIISTALDLVHITRKDENMQEIKSKAALLNSLLKKELIIINYNLISYVKSDYEIYHQSYVFKLLCQTVEEGKKKKEEDGFLFDYAFIKKGRAAIVSRGKYILK